MEGEHDKKVGQKQPVEVVVAIELLQDLIESLIPSSSSSESDPDGQPNQVKLISQGSKYTRTRKLISLEKPIEGVQLDIDLLNFVGVVKVCDLLNGMLKSPTFLHKLSISPSNSEEFPKRQVDESSSWNLISEADLLMVGPNHLKNCINQESYVAVTYKDVEEGIASYTASYLSTLKEMKEMTPEQLRKALEKTFSVPKNKGKLQKLWDGSKTIYNTVSWAATATGLFCRKYNNSALGRVASAALSIPWRKITKLGSK
ncbi:uncharacterized protein LOC131053340 isoform X1 [Cryptomeria japonica]|uniref:uncharacterized protein LOC131053340 isoform X1 n=1 Tax=Cryptomeria japonica TaxID=3369 RepID=UPI0025AC7C8C|nr:uncharacterized protein LOC131053340 isoform X1 [Cryptomeria japonica]